MKHIWLLLKIRLAEIEADGGVPGARDRLARARAEYTAAFPQGVRFTWEE